jgi:UDP-N-acetylmuramate--alanine ligase
MLHVKNPPANAQTPLSSDPGQPLALKGRRVHFVGIGGCGMSGLARIARSVGAVCTGTDSTASDMTEALTAEGIPVTLRQAADTLPAACDMLVISAAIKPDHPELLEAQRRGVPVVKYAQMVGRLMLGRTGVAIAGTHGKSTTTSMLAHVLIQTGLDPTFIVGATCDQIGGGARAGRPDVLIAEACEYDRSFHNFHPTHGVVLNVEADHLDIYKSLDEIVESFRQFAQKIAPTGTLLIGHEDAHRTAVAAGLHCHVETIGFAPQADWCVRTTPTNGHQRVSLLHKGKAVAEFDCLMPGAHMAYNACVAAVTAHRLGAEWSGIAAAIGTFRGLDRRMQKMGVSPAGVTVIDDYGHHPTEIDATLRALRTHYKPEEKGGRLICVFQPHQHSRTRFLLDQFATSFSDADIVIVPHIYFVRDSEADRRAVSATDLVNKLVERGVVAVHINDFDAIVAFLRQQCRPNDLLVVMGAGPVWKVGAQFLQA